MSKASEWSLSLSERAWNTIRLVVILWLIREVLRPPGTPEPEPSTIPPRVRANLRECGRILRRINEKEGPPDAS